MSDKRFTIDNTNRIFDNKNVISKTEVVALLNGQYDDIKYFVDKIFEQSEKIGELQKENLELKKDLQTVHNKNKELQTENLELNHMNEQLREINKDLGDDLYNCRLNKNIIDK